MPRRKIDARAKILESLAREPRSWSDLIKDTGLSKAALSTHLRTLIEKSLVITSADTSTRPPKTVYSPNVKAFLLRESKTLYSSGKEKLEESKEEFRLFPEIGKWVLKHPQKLDELVRLTVISSLWYQSRYSVDVPSDNDVDVDSVSSLLGGKPLSVSTEEVESICMERLVKSTRRMLKKSYGVEVSEQKIKQEIDKIRQEGFFDVGQKSHFGIRVTKKLADYYVGREEDWDTFYRETDGFKRFSQYAGKPGRGWKEDLWKLCMEAEEEHKESSQNMQNR